MLCLASPQPIPWSPSRHLLVRLQCSWKMQLHHHWFVSVWNRAVQTLGTCISGTFFFLNSFLSHSFCISALSFFLPCTSLKSILSMPHRPDDGSLAAYHAFHQTTKGSKHVYTDSCAPLLKSILCGISGDWHILCPSRVGFMCSKMRQLGKALSLLPKEKDRQNWNRETEREEGHGEWCCRSFLTVAWTKANVNMCVMC